MAEQLYLARKTVIEMLEDRGYNNNLVKNHAFSIFNKMYDNFSNYSGVFDLNCSNENGQKTIVKFLKTINQKKESGIGIMDNSDATAAKKEILELLEFTRDSFFLQKRDTVIFIICYGESLHEMHTNLEMKDEDLQIFHQSRLITNISHHNLVPKHEIISDKDKEYLKKKFKLQSLEKLPHIATSDPMAKYLNMRHGDICRIYRASKNAGLHICYRYCKEIF